MLKVLREDSTHEDPKIQAQREVLRFEAAKAAAPYMHPRLNSVEVSGKDGGAIQSNVTLEVVGVAPKSETQG